MISIHMFLYICRYDGSPSFLRMQNSLETLNTAITALNGRICPDSGTGKRLETFTDDEIAAAVPDITNVKVVCLGLVHLKRLDIGSENGIKVYKVRLYY